MRQMLLPMFALSVLQAQPATAGPRMDRFSEQRYMAGPVAPLEARGCYYRRGREYCGRYCYIEINGRRYCQERARDAVPQAGIGFFGEPPPEAGYVLK
ncbi:hypothetical protein [Hyphomicrobium sp.]|uniref:hypothetical protein n=1 Tax=Hyphomicrobium sp. TaxID=82 RepID=UPI002E31F8FC|nr:hypothetical protein [Hyphomicrobium sp.]HEX2840996.1 hypothetical protein [Hyphomicrobium sp.]